MNGLTVASMSVEAVPPWIDGSETMKSTKDEKTGRISSNDRRLFSPEKLTDVEYIGPDIAITRWM